MKNQGVLYNCANCNSTVDTDLKNNLRGGILYEKNYECGFSCYSHNCYFTYLKI